MDKARITSFLVKVASRCNLDCDYCYVYHHADQSWRGMPRLLSAKHRDAFSDRLAEHVQTEKLNRVAVILHGGEPLLAGHDAIAQFARQVRLAAGAEVEVDVGLQTNGLLLSDEALDALEAERIAVSLSMDGPRQAHDLHRTTRRGRSSFDKVQAALERLKRRPSIFAGVIAVIDASIGAETLFEFFEAHQVANLDFLLPDSHHDRPPPGRGDDPALYERWLLNAFDTWLDRYPHIAVRTFEALLDGVAGLPSGTDAFGFGDVSLVTLETDGTWHDLDVLKVAGEGSTRLIGSVTDTSIDALAASEALAVHRRLLTKAGLSEACRSCEVVDVCGGGAVPHRFGRGGFDNPTIYGREMKALIQHARARLVESLAHDRRGDERPAFDVEVFELAETSAGIVADLREEASARDKAELIEALGDEAQRLEPALLEAVARRAGSVAWARARRATLAGRVMHDVDGAPITAEADYLGFAVEACAADGELEVGRPDDWLRKPFGAGILFEQEALAGPGRSLVDEALTIIERWRPPLAAELRLICSAVQFIRDPSAHLDKIVSFSDDSVPGALFVSIAQGSSLIDPYDLADSLIHEYRHQKLYLFERRHPTTRPGALVTSPWREDLRPASGLLHAAFVFVELRRFWEHVRDYGPKRLHNRAVAQLEETERNLTQAFDTLRTCELTGPGRLLAEMLETRTRRLPLAA